ncbi:MAG: glycoside hydrolase family 3 C-terminal domain-containing protein [Bacteroidetes bacterium]|jgi:beta-glucosidase|nr:glycoside hydrolase family 3 C-terminal domain-containing protein [Bacteroidota bacterium]MDF1864201.1 glycoside hydrolase family 3 C-terminal domain-containing protein [Saprospiraceae bacterium]
MKNLVLMLFIGISQFLFAQNDGFPKETFPYQNPNLSLDQRVDDLVSRMTLEEKAGQLMYTAPAIERLNVPEYNWWNECLHGVARNGRATVFPQAIGMAATWDTDLMQRIGDAIATEGRAKYNVSIAHGHRGRYQGLTFWSPNVNIFRDPRWGRGQETYGEDPFLTSRIGVAFVKGLQGDHPMYIKAAGMGKHYAVHNGPEKLRHVFDAKSSMKDLWETYLPAFEALVKEANVEGIMGAYNRTNGDVCCAHPYLMKDVLRKQWGFKGYYVSDCWAIKDFYDGHNIVKTAPEAAGLALNTGCNLNCGNTYPHLLKAIEEGHTSEAEIDRNLKELLPTRFRLGLFDPFGTNPFDHIGPEMIRHPKHIELTKEAATKSIVLLKNKDNTLPLNKDIGSIFVTGPMATHMQALLANYYGVSEDMKTFLEGIVGKTSPQTSIKYRQGALLDEPNRNPNDWFSGVAEESDVTIACIGISQLIEGEEGESIASRHFGDREEIGLPQNQINFLKKIRSKAKKLVVVITAGSAVSCPEVYEMADALLYVWYPGEQGGNALGDIVFGDANPSGRLPVTIVKSIDDLPPFEDYALANRTYRYQRTEPLFSFGFGLSYTNFKYSNLKLSKTQIKKGESVSVDVTVSNVGNYQGDEVIQLYLTDMESDIELPKYALKGFQRVSLQQGDSKTVTFEVTPEMMQMVNENGERLIESGDFKVYVGGSVPSKKSLDLGSPQFLNSEFIVE